MRRALALLLFIVSLGVLAAPSGPPDFSWPDGSRYWGTLRFNQPHGHGYLAGPDGRSYEGDFADGKFHGRGRVVTPGRDSYEGQFVNGCLTRLSTEALVNVTAGGGSTVPSFIVSDRP